MELQSLFAGSKDTHLVFSNNVTYFSPFDNAYMANNPNFPNSDVA